MNPYAGETHRTTSYFFCYDSSKSASSAEIFERSVIRTSSVVYPLLPWTEGVRGGVGGDGCGCGCGCGWGGWVWVWVWVGGGGRWWGGGWWWFFNAFRATKFKCNFAVIGVVHSGIKMTGRYFIDFIWDENCCNSLNEYKNYPKTHLLPQYAQMINFIPIKKWSPKWYCDGVSQSTHMT